MLSKQPPEPYTEYPDYIGVLYLCIPLALLIAFSGWFPWNYSLFTAIVLVVPAYAVFRLVRFIRCELHRRRTVAGK